MVVPGSGGAGGARDVGCNRGGAGGSSNGSGGGAGCNDQGSTPAGGGGGWGASGGYGSYAPGAGGKCVQLNGYTVSTSGSGSYWGSIS